MNLSHAPYREIQKRKTFNRIPRVSIIIAESDVRAIKLKDKEEVEEVVNDELI